MSLAALSSTPAYGAQQALERVAQLEALIARANEPVASAGNRTGGTAAPAPAGPHTATVGGAKGNADFAGALAQASAQETPASAPLYSTPAYAPAYGLGFPAYGAPPPASYASQESEAPAAGSAAPADPAAYRGMIEQAAVRYGIEPAILQGLIQQESGFDPSARSGAGAMGLTQLMPSTAAAMGVSDPLDPQQSIEGGARYLGELLSRFRGNVTDAIAAYNAGPGAVSEYGGVPPYAETQNYVTKVLQNAASYRASQMGVNP